MAASKSTFISTGEELGVFLSSIEPDSTLYIDLEGNNLGRHGTITLVTILVHPQNVTGVVDVLTLGESAFSIQSDKGQSLKSIFEDPGIATCVWDVRNDADALWAHFKVALAGVIDIQLLENASRPAHFNKYNLSGLGNAVKYDLAGIMGNFERQKWMQTKSEGAALMPTDVFSKRPLPPNVLQYCVNDVVALPALRNRYTQRITPQWLSKAMEESRRRAEDARSPGFNPGPSPAKALGPWGNK